MNDQQITKENLAKSERKFSSIFHFNPDPIAIIDRATQKIVNVNQAFLQWAGYEKDEVEGMSTKDIPFWANVDDLKKVNAALRAKGKVSAQEVLMRKKNGDFRHVIFSARYIDIEQENYLLILLHDITNRKIAEDHLRRSESQLSSIIQFLPDATLVVDMKGKVIAWNRAMEELTGIKKEEMFGHGDHACTIPFYGKRKRHLIDLIESEDPELESEYQYVQRKEKILHAETFLPSVYGGKGAYVFATAAPLSDHQGNQIGAIESIRDVTKFRRTEEDLKEARKRLDQIIDYLPDATLVIDVQGKVIAWNKAIEQMTGIQAGDMLGKGDHEYALPFYGKRRPILIDLVLHRQKEIEAEYTSFDRRGTVLYGEAYMPALKGGDVFMCGTASVLRDSKGTIVGAIESVRDITDRKKAEENYKSIFDNSVMGIFQVTKHRRIIRANAAFARIFRYASPAEVVDTIDDMARQLCVSPADYKAMARLIKEKQTVQGLEVELFKKDGKAFWACVSGYPVCDISGKFSYYEGTIQDVSERRRLESLLRQAQKMEAIGSLAGGIAHDFNNILASMIGFTEMADKETRENIRRKYHDRVLQSCDRAKHLVSQILSFSRQKEQEKYPVDIRFIIQEALTLLRATLPSTIEIRQEITDEQTTVLADPTQIHQIMMNLCTNAAYAMKEKGGFIDIHLSNIQIPPSLMPPHPDLQTGSYIQLSIRDTGQGIDSAIQDKIFDPFFTTKKPNEGTGLGLSVVYGIVKSCGGAVDVQSSLGKGATFVIYLPSIHREAYQERTEEDDLDLRGNERILFIDDEESLVVLAQAFFQSKGYQITSTVSSIEALTLFQRTPEAFDLVITDMTMPEMTGADLARSFLTIRPNLPIILCTGYSDAIHLEKARKLNIRELVAKPVSMRDLGILVRRLLNR